MRIRAILTCLFFYILVVSHPLLAGELRVSVAASMNEVIRALASDYAKARPDLSLLPNFASSGSLAKQIAQGAPADLYISANPKWMAYLVNEGRIAENTVRVFAENRLVFVGGKGSAAKSLTDLPMLARIAIGSPKSVPAGQYALQVMEGAGIYKELMSKHSLVMAKDVRQALIYAERGEVDGAFVYLTDARLAQKAVVLFEVDPGLHEPIRYPMGLTHSGLLNPEAKAFYDYLATQAAREILISHGFSSVTGKE